jgi:opacity protein-like surface antigen
MGLCLGVACRLGFEVNDRVTLDFGYRYLPSAMPPPAMSIPLAVPTTPVVSPMHFEGISSHDFTFGFRYALGGFGGGGTAMATATTVKPSY